MDDELDLELALEDAAEPFTFHPLTMTTAPEDVGKRLDVYLAALPAAAISRSLAQKLVDDGNVTVNTRMEKSSYKLRPHDQIVLLLPAPESSDLVAEDIPLSIIYEDSDIIVVDKPAGLVVHPAPGHLRGTLVNALLFYDPSLLMNGSNRPGIVHRLDKDTSGLIVVARHDRARESIIGQMQARTVYKEYQALLQGGVEQPQGIIDAPIARDPHDRKRMAVIAGGRNAVSRFATIASYSRYTHVRVVIETGRTHQIRVHLTYIGHPVVGDRVYGNQLWQRDPVVADLPRQFLHAHKLGLHLPTSGEYREFVSPLPADLQAVLGRLTVV